MWRVKNIFPNSAHMPLHTVIRILLAYANAHSNAHTYQKSTTWEQFQHFSVLFAFKLNTTLHVFPLFFSARCFGFHICLVRFFGSSSVWFHSIPFLSFSSAKNYSKSSQQFILIAQLYKNTPAKEKKTNNESKRNKTFYYTICFSCHFSLHFRCVYISICIHITNWICSW